MKNQLNKILTALLLFFFAVTATVQAQEVTTSTPDVVFFCADAGNYDLGASTAVGTNPRWIVRHSLTPVLPANLGSIIPVVLNGNSIPAASLVTGYFYITSISDESCESLPETILVYKFAPLTASITGADDYCEESPKIFTATATSTDGHTTFAYQWYTFDGTTETAISGATGATYTPIGLTAGNTTSYKVRIGYSVGVNKYCSNLSGVEAVTVTAKPTKPVITVEGVTGESW
ncbi:hypothetical protein [Sphingobacterium sp. xlx-130]|uniref:hypothetical protein n=1 Tax=Sphingobacterium sp. xlx-130 TaxID=2654323 RepID=UPI0013D91E36|nr:hypothetical protein [Sphingobacterium sp. xlx-130]